jgi:hypothetical protein
MRAAGAGQTANRRGVRTPIGHRNIRIYFASEGSRFGADPQFIRPKAELRLVARKTHLARALGTERTRSLSDLRDKAQGFASRSEAPTRRRVRRVCLYFRWAHWPACSPSGRSSGPHVCNCIIIRGTEQFSNHFGFRAGRERASAQRRRQTTGCA